jgi:hypothetical protein
MNLPRAVREQAERAEAAHLALINGNTAPPAPVAPEPPVETPPVEPPTPVAPVVAAPEPVPTPAEPPVADSWELKYKVLNGKYTAEVPRLAARIRELEEQLRSQPAPSAPSAAPAAPAGMTPESVVAQYGEDFAAAVDAIAAARAQSLRDEIAPRVDGMVAATATHSRNEFLRDLTGLVRNWQQIDQDAGFTAYLDEFDPQTGRTRREFFQEADQANNAARVASFFAAYARGTAAAPAPAPAPSVPSVEHLIQPDSSRHSEAPPGKKLWTAAEVSRFYRDAGKPQGPYTQKQIAAISQEIDAAVAEGRYVG